MSTNRAFLSQRIEKLADRLAHKHSSVALIGVLAFLGSAAMGLLQGIPLPQTHDEFSYLLGADTFAHGRLTNPTHPLWIHFETMHVIQQPTYMSKYMPAQGIFLMLGRVIGGHPIVGVWLSMAFMCAAICWMLHAWLPARWALLGGIFAIIHPNIGIGNYWAQSYWGGAVAAAGGALLLGSVRYLMGEPRTGYAAAAALGLAILANSRPYEGVILSFPVGLGLLTWLVGKERPAVGIITRRIILPFAIIGVITVGAMAYYNYRVTSNAMRLPYLVHEQTYSMTPHFIWQALPPKPVYHHKIIEDFYALFEFPYYLEKSSFSGFIKLNFLSFMEYFVLVGSVFTISLIGSAKLLLAQSWKNSWGRFALFIYGFFILGMMIETYLLPHYWAPVTALNYYFILEGLRLWRERDRRVGTWMVAGLPLLALAILVMTTYLLLTTRDDFTFARQRARLLAQLHQGSERHLILVKYGPRHSYFNEWVYNDADIDGSKVVWARAIKADEDCRLVDYFKDRRIWSLEIDRDDTPMRLVPFPTQSCR